MATITLHLLTHAGTRRSIEGRPGRSLMQAATAAGIAEIAADCGGLLSCATCHVIVDEAWAARLPPPSADELSMLELTAAPREPNSRLSCQLVLDTALDGLSVRLPPRQY
jgi:2Fe-2S ferredoxin